MADESKKSPWLPPRWVVRAAWSTHRGLYRITGGRLGLRAPRDDQYGMMQVTTIGRRTGQPRSVILGYFDDGENLVTMAMNGWSDGEPAWWLNLQDHPEATVRIPEGESRMIGRAAVGEERERLWDRWREIDTDLDAYAALRSSETAVVVFEPAPEQT